VSADVDEVPALAMGLGLALNRLRSRLRVESGMTGSGWTTSQLSILVRLTEGGPMTSTDVAQAEHIRRQSAAESINALRAGGLVSSQPDPEDGRKTLLNPTDEGRALVDSILSSRAAWLIQAVQALDPEQRDALRAGVDLMQLLADCDPTAPTQQVTP
jgi:DNA-binding MarR family transcriptional regulator